MRKLSILGISILLLSGLLSPGCEDSLCNCSCDSYNATVFSLNDTVDLKYSRLYCNPDYEIRLSFDSLTDSRCPIGAECIWEGNASFQLIVRSASGETNSFRLNTFGHFLSDTIVNGLRYELIDVLPYPKVDKDYEPDDYILQLVVSD